MKDNRLILVGGGGHCRSCIEVIRSSSLYKLTGVIDKKDSVGCSIFGVPVIGTDDDIKDIINQGNCNFLLTLGQIKSSKRRRDLAELIKNAGGVLPSIWANTAIISKLATVNDGTVIMHKAFVNAGVCVGEFCIVNTCAVLEHDVTVGHFTHISTMAVLNGGVKIGSDCFIGSNAVIAQEVSICDQCTIGAGSVVIKSITTPGVYVGNPVKKVG